MFFYLFSVWINLEQSCGSASGHCDSKDSIHSHSDHSGSHKDTDAAGSMNDALPSRKSSSSTDSCLSGNSRSGSESAGAGVNYLFCPIYKNKFICLSKLFNK